MPTVMLVFTAFTLFQVILLANGQHRREYCSFHDSREVQEVHNNNVRLSIVCDANAGTLVVSYVSNTAALLAINEKLNDYRIILVFRCLDVQGDEVIIEKHGPFYLSGSHTFVEQNISSSVETCSTYACYSDDYAQSVYEVNNQSCSFPQGHNGTPPGTSLPLHTTTTPPETPGTSLPLHTTTTPLGTPGTSLPLHTTTTPPGGTLGTSLPLHTTTTPLATPGTYTIQQPPHHQATIITPTTVYTPTTTHSTFATHTGVEPTKVLPTITSLLPPPNSNPVAITSHRNTILPTTTLTTFLLQPSDSTSTISHQSSTTMPASTPTPSLLHPTTITSQQASNPVTTVTTSQDIVNGTNSTSTIVGVVTFLVVVMVTAALLSVALLFLVRKRRYNKRFQWHTTLYRRDHNVLDPYFNPVEIETKVYAAESLHSILDSLKATSQSVKDLLAGTKSDNEDKTEILQHSNDDVSSGQSIVMEEHGNKEDMTTTKIDFKQQECHDPEGELSPTQTITLADGMAEEHCDSTHEKKECELSLSSEGYGSKTSLELDCSLSLNPLHFEPIDPDTISY